MIGRVNNIIIKLKFVIPNLIFSQGMSPAQDVFIQLYIGYCPQNLCRQLTSLHPQQNPLFSQK